MSPPMAKSEAPGRPPPWIAAAPVVFVLFWASGFPIVRFGLDYAEPFTLMALRSAATVAIVVAVLPFVRVRWPQSWRAAGHIAMSGFLLLVAYLGCMFIALGEGVSQGLAALIAGMQPLLTAALVGWWLSERISGRQWLGFVLGFGGLVAVMWERAGISSGTALGFSAIALTPIFITAGSLYQKRFCADMDLRAGMIIQHSVAGLATYGIACVIETRTVDWGVEAAFAVGWLALVLSVVATNLYYVMLRRGEAARVSSLFYLTPPTAAVLGYLTYDETFGTLALAGFAVSAAGVALVTMRAKAA